MHETSKAEKYALAVWTGEGRYVRWRETAFAVTVNIIIVIVLNRAPVVVTDSETPPPEDRAIIYI